MVNPEDDNHLIFYQGSQKIDVICPAGPEQGKMSNEYKVLNIMLPYQENVSLGKILQKIIDSAICEPDDVIFILIRYLRDVICAKAFKIGTLDISQGSRANPNLFKINLTQLFDVSYGNDALENAPELLDTPDPIVYIALCLMSCRYASYRSEATQLRLSFQTRLKTYITGKYTKSSVIGGKIGSGEGFFSKLVVNDKLTHIFAIFDCLIYNEVLTEISYLRICTLNCRHRDNAALMRCFQLVSNKRLDREFILMGCVENKLAGELMLILKDWKICVEEVSWVPYMRMLGLVKKSQYSATEMPHLFTYLSTILALLIDPRFFKVTLILPSAEVAIVIAYLVARLHKSGEKIGRFFSKESGKTAGVPGLADKINDAETKLDKLEARLQKSIQLTRTELNNLKKESAAYSDRSGSIAARIDKMVPVEDDYFEPNDIEEVPVLPVRRTSDDF